MGPTFTLQLWDTGQRLPGQPHWRVAYQLAVTGWTQVPVRRVVLFEGDDFGCPQGMPIDSDQAVRHLMGFLTLRPGDTDDEYFDAYTPRQRAFCEQHAESLAACSWHGRMLTEDE